MGIEEAKAKMAAGNPGDASRETETRKSARIPFSAPVRKLEVPTIAGYRCRWLRGTQARLTQALRAGYEYVQWDEVGLNAVEIGGDAKSGGSTDMGSRVSVVEGGETDGSGNAIRLYLMKQKLEYAVEDDAILAKTNDSIAQSLTRQFRSGQVGGQEKEETSEDFVQRYVDKERSRVPALFKKKGRG